MLTLGNDKLQRLAKLSKLLIESGEGNPGNTGKAGKVIVGVLMSLSNSGGVSGSDNVLKLPNILVI
jgi:hypothetical protein